MSDPQLPALLIAAFAVAVSWQLSRLLTAAASGYRQQFQVSARRNLADLFLFVDPARLFQINCAAIVVVFLAALLWTGNAVVAAVLAAAAGASPPLVYRWLKRRRQARIVGELPDTLLAVATSMRSGLSLNQALETVIAHDDGPLAQELELLLRELRVGADYGAAMDGLYQRVPAVEIQLVTAAMRISREIGGNLSEALERISATLRSRLQMEGKIKSLTAQGKLQGLVMVALPVFLIIVLRRMEPQAMSYLFTTWYGWSVVGLLVLMLAVGHHFIRRIVNIDV